MPSKIDYFGLGDINDAYIRYKSHTFVDRQEREICVEMYDAELTFDGVFPPQPVSLSLNQRSSVSPTKRIPI